VIARAFSIRKASLRDGEKILQCLREAFAPYQANYTSDAFTDTVLTDETIRQRFAEMTVLIAIDQSGHVIGTVAYKAADDGEGHVRGMAVSPQWQGSNVAQALLDQVEYVLRKMHCKAMTLDTTRPLRRAIHFYQKNGFLPTGKVSSFFGMDLFAYRKNI
jgi:N-acetylglutamate synthase-like GNAT family acetyltransferase